jgi:hypothetical protein
MKSEPILLLLLCYLLVACEDLVRFPDQDSYPKIPVIESVLTDYPEVQKVRVTYTVDISDSLSYRLIPDADVRISSSDGNAIDFEYHENGWYYSPVFQAKHGVVYTLEVTVDEVTYKSSGFIHEMNDLDSVYYRYNKIEGSSDSAYFVYFDVNKTDNEKTGYYLFDVDTNGSRITHGSELYIFEDKYVKEIRGLSITIPLQEYDTMAITLYSLSKELFDYYFKLGYQVFSLDLSHISYQTNLPPLFEPWTPGYFQVSAVSRKEIVITSEN